MRIGLFGGSFNPAHDGHRHVSLMALKRLGLDRVWWLVTPGNPLKDPGELPPTGDARARRRDRLPTIPASTSPPSRQDIGARYTVDTLAYLKRRCPGVRFVWIMGADNLAGFHRWRGWRASPRMMPIAVIDRPGWTLKAIASRGAIALSRSRIREAEAPALPGSRRRPGSSCTARAPICPPPSFAGCDELLLRKTLKFGAFRHYLKDRRAASAVEKGSEPEPSILAEAGRSRFPLSPERCSADEDIRAVALACLEDMKAENTVEIDLVGKTSLADTMIITSGRSTAMSARSPTA